MPLLVGALLASAALGCSQIGPSTIESARFDYNEEIVRSFDRQMLLNLVRLRYQDSILFLDLTSVVASYERAMSVGAGASVTLPPPSAGEVGLNGSATFSESPTISYSPLQGEDFAKRLLTPIQPSAILLLSRSGWGLERLLLCTVQQLNELQNATGIGGVAPKRVLNYTRFKRVAALLRDLQENGHVQLNTLSGDADSVALTAGPIPMDDNARAQVVEVRNLLNIKRPSVPGGSDSDLRPAPAPAPSPGAPLPPAAQVPQAPPGAPAAAAGTDPAQHAAPIQGSVTIDATGFPRSPAHVLLIGRSILGVMAFLAQHIQVPQEHVKQGLVRITLGRDGKPFDWGQVSGDLFRVYSSPTKPKRSFLEVFYRGNWFYIDDADLESKSTYTLVAQLFSLQAASSSGQAPVLTIPTR